MARKAKSLVIRLWVKTRSAWSWTRRRFARGTFGFAFVITLLSFIIFSLMATFTRLFSAVLVAPILAGLTIGFYAKGTLLVRIKAAFFGVLIGTVTTLVLLILLVLALMPELTVGLCPTCPNTRTLFVTVFVLTPIALSVLGFGGSLVGLAIAALLRSRKPSVLPKEQKKI